MLREVKAPNRYIDSVNYAGHHIFLAGSIEMGTAIEWQKQVVDELSTYDKDITILNPRRESWDATWKQTIHNPVFREQVEWELNAMEYADTIAMYFDPETKSPITLLELGLHAENDKLIVCCPQGFWRRGNIEVVCWRCGISLVDTMEEFIKLLKSRIA